MQWWRAWWPGLVVMGIGVAGYAVLLDWVSEQEWLWALDDPILEFFAAHRIPSLTDVMVAVSWVFGPVVLPILVAVGSALWAWRTGQWFNAAVLAGSMVVAGLLSLVLKYTVDRPRPPQEFWQEPGGTSTPSFPSGHTLCATTFVLVLGFLAWHIEKSWKVLLAWLVAAAFVIGTVALSRLYLGYHFLTDVVAGFFAALTVLGLTVGVVRQYEAHGTEGKRHEDTDAGLAP